MPRKPTKAATLLGLVLSCCFAATSPTSANEQKPTAKPTSCQASDIALDELKSRVGRTHVYILGRIVNNCNSEAGVQIKLVILDHAGAVLHVSDFWPASTENIPAHSGFAFQTMVEGVNAFDRFQVTVISMKRWTE